MIERESFQNATTLFVKSRFTNDLAASLQHIKFLNSFKELTKFLSRPALKYFPTDTLETTTTARFQGQPSECTLKNSSQIGYIIWAITGFGQSECHYKKW